MRLAAITVVLLAAGCNNPAQDGAKNYFDAALAKNQEAELDAAIRALAPTMQCQHLARELEALRGNPDFTAVGQSLTRIKAATKEQGCGV